jgi:flagellar basal-body rod modification protein FlgD
MQSIQQMVSGSQQAVKSGLGVASSLTKPRAAVAGTTASTTPSTGSSTAAATGASTITASDFLTLLVAEMKNQDPTTPTDPAQYITQMVNVNSLQQLIGINQGISSLDTAAGAKPAATGAVTAANTAAAAASGTGVDAMLAGMGGTGAADPGNGTPTWLSALSAK